MITKLDIQEKDGFLIMKDFPTNCIFNKVKTGCGATTIALTNDESYIIAVPTTELIENKCYPTKDTDGNVKAPRQPSGPRRRFLLTRRFISARLLIA